MDWQKNRLWIGALVFAALLAVTFFVVKSRSKEGNAPATGSGSAASALPTIHKNDVDSLEIRRPGEPPIRLTRSGSAWRVVAPVDAIADMTAINAALDKLDTLEVTGPAAANRANHARLEVSADKGIRVIVKKGATTLADLWIGAFRSGATMVRVEGQDRVYAVEGSIKYAFNKDVKDWRDREITDLDPNDVVAITFQGPKGTFGFAKNGDDWSAAPGAAVLARFSPSKLAGVVQSAARLRATDFAATTLTAEQLGFDTPEMTTITFRTGGEGGVQDVTLQLGKASSSGDREFYARRAGVDTVYIISSYLANRLAPDEESLSMPADGGVAAAPAAPPEMPPGMEGMGGMPPGMGGPGGPGGMPGGGQIPPELMRQIQQQLQQQRAQGGGGGGGGGGGAE